MTTISGLTIVVLSQARMAENRENIGVKMSYNIKNYYTESGVAI
jgi:hypothetical protein